MKILIWATNLSRRSAGKDIYNELKSTGHDVYVIEGRYRAKEMLTATVRIEPDWLFSCAVDSCHRSYYQYLRQQGIRVALWYADQWCSQRERLWKSLIGSVDVIIFSQLNMAQRFADVAPCVVWMPQYFNEKVCRDACGHLPKRLNSVIWKFGNPAFPDKIIYDICFIGTVDQRRRKFLAELQGRYNCFVHRCAYNRTGLTGYNMAAIYAQSKIAVNIQHAGFLTPGDFITSNRAYNAMGSGAFFLNHPLREKQLLWTNHHCRQYDGSIESLVGDVNYYLKHDELREQIAHDGQCNILSHHTLQFRAQQYIQLLRFYDSEFNYDWNIPLIGTHYRTGNFSKTRRIM